MIESRDAQGKLTKIYLQNDKARIEMPANEGYVVMDVGNKTMHVVLHQKRMVMDMSNLIRGKTSKSGQASSYVDSYLKSRGQGPKIAGYETEHQEVYADGQYCGSVFVSIRAMNELNLKRHAHALQTMGDQIEQNFSKLTGMNMNSMVDKCTQAEKNLLDKMMDIGFPLKSIDQNRRLESLVTRLLRNTKLPENAFVIPAQYQKTDPTKMMQEAINQTRKQIPNMKDMMNSLPPEAQEMMRQRMRQMQQQ